MRHVKIFLTLSFVFLLGTFGMPSALAKKSNAQMLDHIVVIVNDTPIMESELDTAIEGYKRQAMANNMPLPAESVIRKQALDQLIDRKLELMIADQSGMHVTDEQLNKAIATIAQQNNMSVDELNKKVQAEGLSLTDYHKEIREEILLQQLQQQEVGAKITITPDEVKTFMQSPQSTQQNTGEKEYHLEDILVDLPDNASPADVTNAKTKAAEMLNQLKHGAAIKNNNDLDWRKLGEVPAEFSNHVLTMKTGTFAGPIQTANGFHIIHLLGVRTAKTAATQNANIPSEKQAEELLYQQKFEKALNDWLKKLRGDAVINMHPDAS